MRRYTNFNCNVLDVKMNQIYDSKEEEYFTWYLDELKENGIIKDYMYHPVKFDLISPTCYSTIKDTRRGVESVQRILCHAHTYTPDFHVIWDINHDVYDKFCRLLKNGIMHGKTKIPFIVQDHPMIMSTFIDTKGVFNMRHSDIAIFNLKRSLLMEKHGVHVQKVIPVNMFKRTFTPERFLKCDKINKKRRINYKVRSLEQFIEGKL